MPKDNVSLAALEDVYHALKGFQKEVREIPGSVSRHISNMYSSCESELGKAEKKIRNLQDEKLHIERHILDIQSKISRCNANIIENENWIAKRKSEISRIERQYPVTRESMEYIDASAAGRVRDFYREIDSCRGSIDDCHALQDRLNTDLHAAEMKLSDLKRELQRKQDKLVRMKSALSDVRNSFSNLEAEVRRFCGSAADLGGAEASGIAFCIEWLEEYMNTSI